MDIETTFFRPIPVHLQNGGAEATFFRPIPVQSERGFESFPPDTRSLPRRTAAASFPEHIRSAVAWNQLLSLFFRPISVHSLVIYRYLCTGKSTNTSTRMAGTVNKESAILSPIYRERYRFRRCTSASWQTPISR